MDDTRVSFYLVKFDVLNVAEDFSKMVTQLNRINELDIQSDDTDHVIIRPKESSAVIDFSVSQFRTALEARQQAAMLVTCDRTDGAVINMFRTLSNHFGYRMYSTLLNSFLPRDTELIDVNEFVPTEKISKIFTVKHMVPVFYHKTSGVHYCRSTDDGTMHIVNPGLLTYFLDFDVDDRPTPEFSYRVAGDLRQFVALYDAELIPDMFYEYYERNQKIINYSRFNIFRVNRKVFIKPYFFVYDELRQSFEPLVSDKSALSYADKIRPGENLDAAITRIVRTDLKLAPEYFRAKVARSTGFDRDRENRLTPLLHVGIYLTQATVSHEARVQSQRGWVSRDKTVN